MRFSSALGRLLATGLVAAVAGGVPGAASAAVPTVRAAAAVTVPVGVKQGIPPNHKAWDSADVETPAQISYYKSRGYSLDLINTNGINPANSATFSEYKAVAAAGLTVVLWQGYYSPFWANPANGAHQGNKAVNAAGALKYPKGAQIF